MVGGTLLAGGRPGRLLRLTADGRASIDALLAGAPTSEAARQLGRRLVEAGMAHPVPRAGTPADAGRVTVVVPVRDRSVLLDRALGGLGGRQVLVVDDGSSDPGAVEAVCRRHGARLVRRPVSGGPSAARNQGAALVTTELVAFVDSDCLARAGWFDDLVGLFDDPEVGAVAPRIRPVGVRPAGVRRTALARYLERRSPLDLGPDPGLVGPDRSVRYVPTAALVVRRRALVGPAPFDPELRVGEDVDLVWRLAGAGWRVRYHPAVEVGHHEPTSWSAVWRRRFRYGTSAGPLARRHPGRLAPVELRPWPAAGAVAWLSGHPVLAAALTAGSGLRLARTVRPLGVPPAEAARWSFEATAWTVVGLGRAATTLAAPVVLLGLAAAGDARVGGRWRWRLRWAAAVLLAVPPAVEWWQRRPDLDPVRWTVASVADDAAYGAGVWVGSLRSRTAGPLRPSLVRSRKGAPADGVAGPVGAPADGM
jgi:mycofactocin system glycosyltransferase